MRKPSIGVVGAGMISSFHFRAFAETETPVKIIADLRRETAQPYLDRFGAEYTSEFEAVVNHPEVNTVAIFGPTALHQPVVEAALKHGKNVICEKTLTLTAADSLALGRLAEKQKLLFFTSYMKRFFPAVQKAKELMPRLGHIMSVYCRTYQGGGRADCHTGEVPGHFKPGPDGKSAIVRMAGGGVLVCGGSHLYDLLLYLVGKPSRVYARQFRRDGYDVDFMTHAMFDLDGGGVAHFEGNWHPLFRIGYQNRGWDEGFEISGVNGRIILQTPIWNQPEHDAPILKYYDNETGTWTEYTFDIVCPFGQAERYFLGQIAKGGQGWYDRYVGYRADNLLETTQKSAAANKPLDLVWKA